MSLQTTEQIRIFRTPLAEAQDAAGSAFDRLRTRLASKGLPTNSLDLGFPAWARMARREAPGEFADFLLACTTLKDIMEAG